MVWLQTAFICVSSLYAGATPPSLLCAIDIVLGFIDCCPLPSTHHRLRSSWLAESELFKSTNCIATDTPFSSVSPHVTFLPPCLLAGRTRPRRQSVMSRKLSKSRVCQNSRSLQASLTFVKAQDKQKRLLEQETGHFSMVRALHLADLITLMNGMRPGPLCLCNVLIVTKASADSCPSSHPCDTASHLTRITTPTSGPP